MQVGTYCNREVVICEPDTSIADAARLMRRFHVGSLIAVECRAGTNVPVGIVTDRDLVIEVLAQGVEPTDLAVKDVMSRQLDAAREDEDVLQTLENMRQKGVRRMPVVDSEGALVGLLTADDLLELGSEVLTDLIRLVQQEINRERRRLD